jgi:inositol transport system substrate-binding protein
MEKYMETENLGDKIELIQMDAQSDPTKQNEQVDTLIAQGCKAIILNAGDRNAQVTAVQNASAAGIPVIELCSATAAEDLRETYVGSEDIVSGRMLATALCEAAGGSGKMVLLHGLVGVTAEQRRHEGLQEILDADFPDVEIVAEKICNWSRAEAMTAMENIVQSGLEFNIVYAENDEMAMGALNAIKGSATENVIIGGIDAIPDAVQAVLDGDLYCTVFQDAVSQAEKALEVAILAAEGQDLEPLYDIPYVLVTKDNAADFLG